MNEGGGDLLCLRGAQELSLSSMCAYGKEEKGGQRG